MQDNTPVIVGVGEVVDRSKNADCGYQPLDLMRIASLAAVEDAHLSLLDSIDSLDVVCQLSWPYVDGPAQLARTLGIQPQIMFAGAIGGETPVKFVHEAALRIARGESQVALVVGAEAEYTVTAARKSGLELNWLERDDVTTYPRGKDFLHPTAARYGIASPATAYPLFENAAQAAWGQTPQEGLDESAALWSEYARVAERNPLSWLKSFPSQEQIKTPSEQNRWIAWPYTKSMVANPLVNQGAAVLLTNYANAQRIGIPKKRMVAVLAGASANEPRDYLMRGDLHRSYAQEVVLEQMLATIHPYVFDAQELYSCFPVVPKHAQRIIRNTSTSPTVSGGLSYFGAPLNNYMTHAIAAMVKVLRSKEGETAHGLIYGQGEYMTKHHAVILATGSLNHALPLSAGYSLQEVADNKQPPAVQLLDHYSGLAKIETHTVLFARDGQATHGVVIARTPNGERVVAKVNANDQRGIERLISMNKSPIGEWGSIHSDGADLLIWTFH